MFAPFVDSLRQHGVPVSLREYLAFLETLQTGLADFEIERFYHLARLTLVKDERHIDRFDRAFAHSFQGLDALADSTVLNALDLPEDWLRRLAEKTLSDEDKARIEALGGFEALMDTLRKRLAEQQGRHQGGNKWIGTAGTSPFGAYGYNPEGVRIGQSESRHGRAVKVWDQRAFRNLDDSAELGPRTMKIALRRLRRWAREGASEELDLDGTISASARQGWLDVRTRPERRNAVKVLMLFDIGGSMDPHVAAVQDLFSAARAEFKHLDYFYFHNCPYEYLWRDNTRRWSDRTPTLDILNTYGPDYACILVGDANMSPYEIAQVGGGNEHWNAEPGAVWLDRIRRSWPRHLWINPTPEPYWDHSHSIRMIRQMFDDRMVPMTLDGLTQGMRLLQA